MVGYSSSRESSPSSPADLKALRSQAITSLLEEHNAGVYEASLLSPAHQRKKGTTLEVEDFHKPHTVW